MLQILKAFGNSMLSVDDTRYNPVTTINGFPGVNDIVEPVFIQAFIAKVTVQTLNKSVLCWLARLD